MHLIWVDIARMLIMRGRFEGNFVKANSDGAQTNSAGASSDLPDSGEPGWSSALDWTLPWFYTISREECHSPSLPSPCHQFSGQS